MITLLLALIDGHYKVGFELLYLGAFIIDLEIVNGVVKIMR